MAGLDLRTVQEWMGRKPVQMSDAYADLARANWLLGRSWLIRKTERQQSRQTPKLTPASMRRVRPNLQLQDNRLTFKTMARFRAHSSVG